MISEGSRIEGLVSHSVLSGGVRVEEGAEVYDSVIMSDVHIKKGARIYYSIIDSDTVVEENAMVGNKNCDKDNIRVIEKDSRIKLFQHEGGVNKGLTRTVKLGIEKAQSECLRCNSRRQNPQRK